MAIGDKLFVADKPTLDAIKTTVDTINAKPSSNGTDLTKVVPYKTAGYVTAGGAGFKEVVNVSGKGFLSKAMCFYNQATQTQIKVTIDGVVKIFLETKSTANIGCGFLKREDIYYASGWRTIIHDAFQPINESGLTVYPNSVIQTMPNICQICVLSNDIPFTTSLLVEVTNTTNTSYHVEYTVIN